MVKITIVGTGYVGLVSGTCLAEIGHEVICSDIDEKKIEMLNSNIMPIYEVGLKELVEKNVKEKRLSFTSNIDEAIQKSEIIFSAVGTPPDENHKADLKFVREVAKTFLKNLNGYKIFVNKSTVPVGTCDMVREIIESGEWKEEGGRWREEESGRREEERGEWKAERRSGEWKAEGGRWREEESGRREEDVEGGRRKEDVEGGEWREGVDFDVVSNPEFLREGAAVKDFLNPDRVVVGAKGERAKKLMEEVYKPLVRMQSPLMITDIKSAELIKYASNSFLATKISFINEIARFCEKVGADVKEVAKGMGLDNRIGPKFLNAGIGYGGSCFPKDVDALFESGYEVGYEFEILKAVRHVNFKQKTVQIDRLKSIIGNLEGKNIAVWGLSFKPRTDDVREAPAYFIIKKLLEEGASVNAFDPVANKNFDEWYKLNIKFYDNKYDTIYNCDALLIITEWDEFRVIDSNKLKDLMKRAIIIDGRNILDSKSLKENAIEYYGVGR